MLIRAWNSEDIPKIAALEKVCFSDPWPQEGFLAAFSSPFFQGVLIEEDGEIIAYACESVLFEDAEIENVAVAPDFRKRGLGRTLMESLESVALRLGAEQSFLEVRVSNEAARTLYQKFGYEPLRVRKKYYSDGEDALVMKKVLKQD